MKKELKRNICHLDDYAILSEVEDISTCQKKHIGGALEYACQFWAKHLLEISSNSHDIKEVHKAIDEFFSTHLLFWIEVLIIMGRLNVGIHAIGDIQQWYISVSHEQFIS